MAYAKQTWADGPSGGTPLSAARLNVVEGGIETADKFGVPLFARKMATESVTSSTTLQDDDHLTLAVVANATYELTAVLRYEGASGGDFKFAFQQPAGAVLDAALHKLSVAASVTTDDNILWLSDANSETAGSFGVGTAQVLSISGLLVVGGTAGTFKLQWAQGTSSATETKLAINSYICLRRVA